jgi:hypothetical protein
MPISYNIYMNDGRGGDVDYTTPIATTHGLTFTFGPLAAPGDTTFAVRAIDTTSGIEEANTDARARIVLDASGNDVTNRPHNVRGLSVRPTRGGCCRVAWGYVPIGREAIPIRFAVYLTPGSSPDLSTPAAVVPYAAGTVGYECSLSGLADQTSYIVAVRAIGPSPLLAGEVESVPVFHEVAPLQGVDALIGISSA